MLSALRPQPDDPILSLMGAFQADPRPGKIDLGVGIYRDAQGQTPVMAAIKEAERQLWERQQTKAYTGLAGDPGFGEALSALVLGDALAPERLAHAAQPGGTGAVHQGLELARLANPAARAWVPLPSWPSHGSIIDHVGLERRGYRYFDEETRGVAFEAMLEDLSHARRGDVVVLHGCCHNPTGADLSMTQWQELAELLEKTGALPLIDLAYQGLGDGLEPDAQPTRLLARRLPEVLIAVSGSKNFGLYRERAGLLIALAEGKAQRDVVQGNLAHLNRLNFSFPPDHGARLITMVLSDEGLRANWQAELDAMRTRLVRLRSGLAAALQARAGSDRFGFIAGHRGMFSRLGATPEQLRALRDRHAVYAVGDSRINIAGLAESQTERLADALIDVGL